MHSTCFDAQLDQKILDSIYFLRQRKHKMLEVSCISIYNLLNMISHGFTDSEKGGIIQKIDDLKESIEQAGVTMTDLKASMESEFSKVNNANQKLKGKS